MRTAFALGVWPLVFATAVALAAEEPQEPRKPKCSGLGHIVKKFRERLTDALIDTPLRDRDGNPYSVKIASAPKSDKFNLVLTDGEGKPSYLDFTVSADGSRIEIDDARMASKGRGLTTEVLRRFLAQAPISAKIEFDSTNAETNASLARIADKIESSRRYRELSNEDPEEARKYRDKQLTVRVRRMLEEEDADTPLWVRVVSSAGWKNVRVRRKTNSNEFVIEARKVADE